MPTAMTVQSPPADPLPADEQTEQEYRSLVRALRETRGHFALFPVESDYRPSLRDALFDQLNRDLSAAGMKLRVVKLSRDEWDPKLWIEVDGPDGDGQALAVIGLEETPGIIPEPGKPRRRPPALALLNNYREALRKRLHGPLLLWCDPFTHMALQEHAPDLFDCYAGLFTFLDTQPRIESPRWWELARPTQARDASAIERHVAGSRAALAFYEDKVRELTEPTPARARALLGLAEALWALAGADTAARLTRAEAAAREALALLSPETSAREWARAQHVLGAVLSDLLTGQRGENLLRAIACYEAALRVVTEADFPVEWALTQNNLGTVYRQLPTGEPEQNLRHAIARYEAALRVYTEADFPMQWAMTQNNLGGAYCALLTGDREGNPRRAIACYEAALRVYTEADFPVDWAMTQNNLGNAYLQLPIGDRGQNLGRAIACYEAALRVCTEADSPLDWARSQNNLGNAYSELPTGDRGQNLGRAIACYEAALRVYTEADFPLDWAITRANMGIALEAAGRLEEAAACWEQAERGFLAVADTANARKVSEWHREARGKLARPGRRRGRRRS